MINEKELIEQLAAIEHQRWSDWHKWAENNRSAAAVARWDRQAATPYTELTEEEKEADRRQVRRYWSLVQPFLGHQIWSEKVAAALMHFQRYFTSGNSVAPDMVVIRRDSDVVKEMQAALSVCDTGLLEQNRPPEMRDI